MRLTDANLRKLDKLARLTVLLGVALWLVSVVGWQVSRVMIGGTALLNVAAVLAGIGLLGSCIAKTIQMKRKS